MAVDTSLAAPFSPAIVGLLTRSMTHVCSAWVELPSGETCPLDVESGTLEWDETRAPRVTASLSCRVPTDAALLGRVDPRTGARVKIVAGYRRPDGAEETALVANLGLRSRRVARPDDVLRVEAASDEALILDGAATRSGSITNATTTGAITAVLNQLLTVTPTVSGSTGPAVSAVLFEDRWSVVQDLADSIGAQVYDNGLRQWVIAPAPAAGSVALELKVGAGGTIVESDAGLSRDDGWGNFVWAHYEWVDGGGVRRTVDGLRRVTSGPFAAVAGNYKVVKVSRDVGTTQAAADAAAAALVARMVTRGRSFEVNAISAYWLRPGHTLEVTLPLGDTETHLVTAVSFDLSAGTMRVTTRLPDNTVTIGA
ncbi:MAG TPA: hypothetical protein VF140_04715 [Phycicoccus sp.]